MLIRWVRSIAKITALVALLLGADDLDVRLADGLSFGGGASVFFSSVTAAAATAVAPEAPGQATAPVSPSGTLNGLFSRGDWLGGFAAGFLGSGLLGLLFGRGVISGLGGVPSYIGLLCQIVLLAMLCRLIWMLWRGGDVSGPAALSPRQLADPYLRSRDDLHGGFGASADCDGGTDADHEPGAHSAEVTSPRGGRG